MKTNEEYIEDEFLWKAYRDDPHYIEIIKKIKRKKREKKK